QTLSGGGGSAARRFRPWVWKGRAGEHRSAQRTACPAQPCRTGQAGSRCNQETARANLRPTLNLVVFPMTNIENLCLNLATVGPQFGFTEVLDAGLKHGFSTVSPWRHHYEAIGVGAAAKETRARGVKVDTVCRISGFGPAVSGAQWSAALDEAKATIEEAVTLEARAIIYPGGGVGEGSTIEDARKRILDGLAQIAPMAHEVGILILVEPLHPVVTADRGAINTLGFALDLCDAVSEGTGVAVDSYNVWWDPQLEASMARAGTRVQGFQVRSEERRVGKECRARRARGREHEQPYRHSRRARRQQ